MNSTLVSTVNEPVVKPKAPSQTPEEGAVTICSFLACLFSAAAELLSLVSPAALIFVVRRILDLWFSAFFPLLVFFKYSGYCE